MATSCAEKRRRDGGESGCGDRDRDPRLNMNSTRSARYPALMCNLYSLTKGQSAIRDLFRAGTIALAICRCFRRSSPTRWRRSFGVERLASASLSWRGGACRGRRSSAVSR